MSAIKNIIAILFLLLIVMVGCTAGTPLQPAYSTSVSELKSGIRKAAAPYALKLADWEIENIFTPVRESPHVDTGVLIKDIESILDEENIAIFPAVRVRITKPPLLLVVSPKDRISYLDRIMLSPDLNDEQIEAVEKQVDELSLSSLVVEIGGFGAAYPAIVSPDLKTKQLVAAAVEEWAHQYLAFRPLGFLYFLDSLGFSQPPDIISMNETLAGMIADEIGGKVYARYNRDVDKRIGAVKTEPDFNFDREMKETRKNVDLMLDAKRVNEAERYMESRRLLFVQHGYKIRKLNQAYFAFHGIYGQDPCAVSPVYDDMNRLRASYTDFAGFVKDVSNMTGYEELQSAVNRLPSK
ncbi:MAG: hypothetical protein NTZ34_05920 [Chloroflexi bacterium]|nr:hypothetical protein [Chloroflexota bacterium]